MRVMIHGGRPRVSATGPGQAPIMAPPAAHDRRVCRRCGFRWYGSTLAYSAVAGTVLAVARSERQSWTAIAGVPELTVQDPHGPAANPLREAFAQRGRQPAGRCHSFHAGSAKHYRCGP